MKSVGTPILFKNVKNRSYNHAPFQVTATLSEIDWTKLSTIKLLIR